jgi:hypothetical protein
MEDGAVVVVEVVCEQKGVVEGVEGGMEKSEFLHLQLIIVDEERMVHP